MPLSEQDFLLLKSMQQLCTQVEEDVKRLSQFDDELKQIQERYKKLGDLYETHWTRLTESDDLDAEQRKRVEALVSEGEYSIFWQDTVWNALSDAHVHYIQLIKSLVQHL